MDPLSEHSLATPSLYHGCSTGDSEDGWTKVTSKTTKHKAQGDESQSLKDSSNQSINKQADQGYPSIKTRTTVLEFWHRVKSRI